MSQAHALELPLGVPAEKPSLELVRAARNPRPGIFTVLVAIVGASAIFISPLLMSLPLADGAYRINELQRTERDLSRDQHAAEEKLWQLRSTQNILAGALALGMQPSGDPVFLDLETGAVSLSDPGRGGQQVGSEGNLIGNVLLDSVVPLDPETIAASNATRLAIPVSSEIPEHGDTEGTEVTLSTPDSAPTSLPPGTIPSPTTR